MKMIVSCFLMVMLTFFFICSCNGYTVEPDPAPEIEVSSPVSYNQVVRTWQHSKSTRPYETHYYKIRVPKGKRAIVTLVYTSIDFLEADFRGYRISVDAEVVPSGPGGAGRRGIVDKVMTTDGYAIIEGWCYGATPCYQYMYYTLTVRYEDLKVDLFIKNFSIDSSSDMFVGDKVSCSFNIAQRGDYVWIDNVKVAIYIDGNLLKESECSVNPDFDRYYWFYTRIPSSGTHTIRVVVDSSNAINELNEENNAYSYQLDIWGYEPFWIRYDLNGGQGIVEDKSCVNGSYVHMPEGYRPGYILKGWALDPEGRNMLDDYYCSKLMVKRNELVTLYAIWELGISPVFAL